MINDDLLDRDVLGFEEWAATPQPEHLIPDAVERDQQRESFREQLRDKPGAVVITHTDADGLSSAALVEDYCGPDTVVQPIDYHGAYRFEHVVEDLLDSRLSSTDVFICDFNLDAPVDGLEELGVRARSAQWYDHHQWDRETSDAVERAGFDLYVDEDECTASLLVRDLPNADFDPYLEELAEVTKDIDLWIRDDPRSERLNVFASIAGTREYVDTVLEHGADLNGGAQQRIDDRLERDRELEAYAVETETTGHIQGYTVATTYVRGGRSSEIGNELCENPEHGFDIAVVMKPHGGMGIYSHSNRETFARCHEVAGKLGGGGHPTASGCDVPVDTFRELAAYWSTEGESVLTAVFQAIADVVEEDDDDE